MNKHIIKLTIITGLFLVLSSNVFALNNVSGDISKKAKETIGNFTNAFESQRQGYGIAENEIVENNITLGEGYEVNSITDSALKPDGNVDLTGLLKNSDVYAFPIKLGSKCIGMAFAKSTGVFQVKSYKEFEADMELAKNAVKRELKNNDLSMDNNVKFVYDLGLNFSGLSVKTSEGDYLIPLKDSSDGNFKKGIKKTSKEVSDIFKKSVKTKKASEVILGGANGTSNGMQKEGLESSYNYLYAIASLAFVITLVCVFIKRKKLATSKSY